MARLTAQQWQSAREKWEANNRDGYAWLAEELGVDKSNLGKRIKSESWCKNGGKSNGSLPLKTTTNYHQTTTELPRVVNAVESVTESKKIGRPTKYKPEYCQMIVDYFSRHESYEILESQEDETRKRAFPKILPTLSRFAVSIGTYPRVLIEWANARDENGELIHPEFSNSYRQAMAMQESLIVEGATMGAYTPAIAKLLLYNHHGYEDKKTLQIEAVQSKRIEEHFNGLVESVLKKTDDRDRVLDGRFERITHNESAD